MRTFILITMMLVAFSGFAFAQDVYRGPNTHEFETSEGPLYVTHVVHGSVMFQFKGRVIHVDPISRGDYSDKPKADLILITHEHSDHLDKKIIEQLTGDDTVIVGTAKVAEQLKGVAVMGNGQSGNYQGFSIMAVPAYNVQRKRSPGVPFHPKGVGNGYVITFGDKRVYVAGDTENIPEMKDLKDIDIAFLPCNLPYTMSPDELVECARVIHPKVLYPYHLGRTDREKLAELLAAVDGVEVRIPEN